MKEIDCRISYAKFRQKHKGHSTWMFSHYHRAMFMNEQREIWEKWQKTNGKDGKTLIKRQNRVYQLWRNGEKPKTIAGICGIIPTRVKRYKWAVYNRLCAEAWRINNSALY